MITLIKKKLYLPIIFIISLLLISFSPATERLSLEIEIDIAPNTLNIQNQGQVVTIHTSIKYFEVDHQSVYLNDIEINSWKSDNRGYFVAKFLMYEVKALFDSEDLIVPSDNLFTLIGYTTDGTEFTGSQVITVINILPSGKK